MKLPDNVQSVSVVKGRSIGMTTMCPQMVATYVDGTRRDVKYDYEADRLIEVWTEKLAPFLFGIDTVKLL